MKKKDKLIKEIGEIVKKAIEGQMDWEAYYEGGFEEPTQEIFEVVNEHLYKILCKKCYEKFIYD
jgi:hypothetical protein